MSLKEMTLIKVSGASSPTSTFALISLREMALIKIVRINALTIFYRITI